MREQFFWRLLGRGETVTADPKTLTSFCLEAEHFGFDGVQLDLNTAGPDPMTLALALARATEKLQFLVAHQAGISSPTLFVQQVNTFSLLTRGRISLHMDTLNPAAARHYGNHLEPNSRVPQLDEFLAVCRAFWRNHEPVNFKGTFYKIEEGRVNTPFSENGPERPTLFMERGGEMSGDHADVLLQRTLPTEGSDREAPRRSGQAAGLDLYICCRPTRQEAIESVCQWGTHDPDPISRHHPRQAVRFRRGEDSAWFLLGTAAEIAGAIVELTAAGFTHFLLAGLGELEMVHFGREVLPLLRGRT